MDQLRRSLSSRTSSSATVSDCAPLLAPETTSNKLGTFQGVFSPVCLSMFSTLLFLRVGYIVGNAGLLESLFQLVLAYSIILLTASSVCALATNSMQMGGGGVYFLISRTLGPEFGAGVGLLFYLANVAGAALFAVGCSEALAIHFGKWGRVINLFPILAAHYWQRLLTASAVNCLNLVICLLGARLFGKTSFTTLAVVIVCMVTVVVSFFDNKHYHRIYNETISNQSYNLVNATYDGILGQSPSHLYSRLSSNLGASYAEDCESPSNPIDFATVFAVLFSGVTGILSGANLSGELRQPSFSIPRGTLAACLFTFLTYALLFVLTAMTCDRQLMFKDCHYMGHVVVWRPITAVGAVLTTFCASASCLIGASRVLHAVARDGMFGRLLGFVKSPFVGVLLSWFLVQLLFFVGSLTKIATLSSIFFLLSYASVNLSCFALEWASAPNFRPSYNYFTWHTALLGVVSSIVMMFVVSPLASSITILLCCAIVTALHFLAPAGDRNWGSISQAILFHQVRKYLLLLDPRKEHVKFWRPQVLLLVDDVSCSTNIIDFTNSLKKGGLYVLGHVIIGHDVNQSLSKESEAQQRLLSLVERHRLKAFVEVAVSSSFRIGVQHLARLAGIGAMKANTIVLGLPSDGTDTQSIDFDEYRCMLNDLLVLKKNVCVHRHFNKSDLALEALSPARHLLGRPVFERVHEAHLDIWIIDMNDDQENSNCSEKWSRPELDATSLFLLQLACILRMLPKWRKLRCRLFVQRDSQSDIFALRADVERILRDIRLHVHEICFVICDKNNAKELIKENSKQTVLALLPIYSFPPSQQQLNEILAITDDLMPLLLVHGVSPVISTSF